MNEEISKKNLMEISPERDFISGSPLAVRYAILASPRSGSTLISRMLYETKMAGDPLEYFNPYLLQLERTRTGLPNLGYQEFLSQMEHRRTSPNGYFGIQLHYSQFMDAFSAQRISESMARFILCFDKLIWVRRRDRLRQAVSFALARRNNVWSSEDIETRRIGSVSEIHPAAMVQAMNVVCGNDFGWERLIKSLRLKVHQVWYEELVADYDNQCAKVMNYLEIPDSALQIPSPPIDRQASEINEQLLFELRTYLGYEPRKA